MEKTNITQRPYYCLRNQWLELDDSDLLKQCSIEGFQASGPGGQKRNRKYSAVRLTHSPTDITVTSSETRSQNDNRKLALKKLKLKIAIEASGPEINYFDIQNTKVSLSNPRYPLFAALIFDRLCDYSFSIRDTADSFKISSSKLIKLVSRDIALWKKVNNFREKLGLKQLSYK